MQEFKSKIGNSLGTFFLMTLCDLLIIYAILYFTTNFSLTDITILGWTLLIVIYVLICYLYAGLTNNNIIVFDNRLEIKNELPLFKKHKIFQFENIKSVTFRHEWTATLTSKINSKFIKLFVTEFTASWFFPTDYKWIKIESDKDYKFYCFGLEMNFYDNEEPYFEDLFHCLADKQINVSWTNTTDKYYSQMTKKVELNKLKK